MYTCSSWYAWIYDTTLYIFSWQTRIPHKVASEIRSAFQLGAPTPTSPSWPLSSLKILILWILKPVFIGKLWNLTFGTRGSTPSRRGDNLVLYDNLCPNNVARVSYIHNSFEQFTYFERFSIFLVFTDKPLVVASYEHHGVRSYRLRVCLFVQEVTWAYNKDEIKAFYYGSLWKEKDQ